jgi:hypothetical protein
LIARSFRAGFARVWQLEAATAEIQEVRISVARLQEPGSQGGNDESALFGAFYQAGVTEDGQVVGDIDELALELVGELSDRSRAAAKQIDDAQPLGFC